MTAIHAASALLPTGWTADVRVEVEHGAVATVESGARAQPDDDRCGILLPGMPNLHSHAFQRAMAGLAERRGPQADTFWTWREEMYRSALQMTPDQVEAVAAQLYVEMLEAGFTRVGEFHYLHHDRDGRPYANIAEMAERIAAAADLAGIGLTLLPVLYAHASFGGLPPAPGQRRFVNDPSRFAALVEKSRESVRRLNEPARGRAVLGVAPHSLRAVTPDELAEVVALGAGGPIHIHAAEQVKEVEDCLAWSGARPVEWLLADAPVGPNWCLIHATHMTAAESDALAGTGAVAGLCPITEANLGDGIFDAPRFRGAGGRFGIGSDSNIRIGVADELRQLEYAQRLRDRQRNLLALSDASTGRTLFDAALRGGAQALGAGPAGIEAGAAADLVSLDAEHPALVAKDGDAILDAWIFAGGAPVDGVWVGGRKLVQGGRHRKRDEVAAGFRKAMRELAAERRAP